MNFIPTFSDLEKVHLIRQGGGGEDIEGGSENF